jgi:membrane-associated phospholipid phosphatase
VRGVASSPAAALRFDALTGTHIFANMYARASDVFGAMPSLHAAYPLLVALALRGLGHRTLAVFAWCYMALMCFAAVYLQHHYVIDVMGGLAYAALGHVIVARIMMMPTQNRELDASRLAGKPI